MGLDEAPEVKIQQAFGAAMHVYIVEGVCPSVLWSLVMQVPHLSPNA